MLKTHLARDGVALITSKKYYFGVGGGTDTFLDLLLHQSQRHATQQRQGKRQKVNVQVIHEMQEQEQDHTSETSTSSSTHYHHMPQNTGSVTEAAGEGDNTLVLSTHAESVQQQQQQQQEEEEEEVGRTDRTDEWRLVGKVVRTYDDGKSNIRELIRVRWEAVE